MNRKGKPMAKKPDYWLQIFLLMSKSEHLHLGYCDDPDEEFISNRDLRRAQENYLELCMRTIPDEVRSVMDVGCGTGEMLSRMAGKGLHVKGMVPDPLLAEKIGGKVGPEKVVLSKFEDYAVAGDKFDLVLFMESFGYIRNMEATLAKAASLLNPGGYILISDFFAKKKDKKDLFSKNFHHRDEFEATFKANPELEVVLHRDITANTLPTIRFCNTLIFDYVLPIADVVATSIKESSAVKKKPYLLKLFNLLFKKKLKAKWDHSLYRMNQIKPEYYLQSCSYEMFLFQKKNGG
jgi:2-polyprenyl-3-methyl-5-hydroxy-6-metoxy-1,4-benzoquinol methylase